MYILVDKYNTDADAGPYFDHAIASIRHVRNLRETYRDIEYEKIWIDRKIYRWIDR